MDVWGWLALVVGLTAGGAAAELSGELLRGAPATTRQIIDTDPRGAFVYMGNRVLATADGKPIETPLLLYEVPVAAAIRLRIEKDGFERAEHVVEAGEKQVLIQLRPRP